MPLSGTFDTMPLTDVVQWIHGARRSGTLTVTAGLEDTHLVFEDGDVVAAGSEDPLRHDLGQALLACGRIRAEDLADAVRGANGPGGVEAALCLQGAVDEATLETTRREMVEELVLDLFLEGEGSFLFAPTGPSPGLLPGLEAGPRHLLSPPLPTQQLLMDCVRRLDEWRRIQEAFPSPLVTIHALGEGAGASPLWHLLRASAGLLSLEDLCLRSGVGRFRAYQQLYDDWRGGRVAVDESWVGPEAATGEGSAETLLSTARFLLTEQQFEEAREVLSTALALAPESAEGRALRRELRAAHLVALYQQAPPHRMPVLTEPLARVRARGLSPRETYLASRLDSGFDVATLTVATPLGELDTLRTLVKLLHAGIVTLRRE